MNKNDIIKIFNTNKELYNNFESKIVILIKELLLTNVNYHHISSRVKEKYSLEKKIEKKNDKYQDISEITDIVGCRIISYFEDDVDKIVDIVKKEFIIDEENSINKKNILESDKFGYLSYHLVCSINDKRLELPEYQKYEGIKFEIQIRSILQHAWAEIEHDIGYKSILGIPKEIRRKFSRIAGLLETADENFCEIKKSIDIYNNKIKDDKNELLHTDLNLNSLILYTKNNKIVKEIDQFISNIKDKDYLQEDIENENLSKNVERLLYFNIATINELNNVLSSKKKIIQNFAKSFLSEKKLTDFGAKVPIGITYFYLAYILLMEHNSIEFQKNYISTIIYENPTKEKIDELFKRLQISYKNIS